MTAKHLAKGGKVHTQKRKKKAILLLMILAEDGSILSISIGAAGVLALRVLIFSCLLILPR